MHADHTPTLIQPQLPFDEIPYGYCHCGCGQKTSLAKSSNKSEGVVRNEPRRFVNGHQCIRNAQERFWEKVDVRGPDECWEWQSNRSKRGYGRFKLNGKYRQAHRIAYQFATGIDPGEMEICHKCDNPPCCNPNHLFEGTRSENMIDCRDKGRGNRPVGEDSGKAKLTESDVRAIRQCAASKQPYKDIATEFGITKENVSAIARRLTWKHVT